MTEDPEDFESKRLADVSVGEAKRALIYGAVIVLALWLCVWLLGEILVALLLGVVSVTETVTAAVLLTTSVTR